MSAAAEYWTLNLDVILPSAMPYQKALHHSGISKRGVRNERC